MAPHARSRSQIAGYVVLSALVLAVGGRWLATRGAHPAGAGNGAAAGVLRSGPARSGGDRAGSAAAPGVRLQPGGGTAVVHVAGAVHRPGVYSLPADRRVQDAIRRAGGATRRADLAAINLAARVQDGVQVVVPVRPSSSAGAASGAGSAGVAGPGGAPGPVSLNTATAEQLETLDGVGPATAAKILEYRRQHGGFRSVEDLTQVSGIGEKRLAALRGKVTT